MSYPSKKFSELLNTLTSNDKNTINSLCKIAMSIKNDPEACHDIAKVAIQYVNNVKDKLKLYSLYVIDIIIKNVGEPYIKLFSGQIGKTFVQAFNVNKDVTIRAKLFSLRLTWKNYFPYNFMHEIDLEVKKIDKAWPIVAKTEQEATSSTDKDSIPISIPDSTTLDPRDPRNHKNIQSNEVTTKRKSSPECQTIKKIKKSNENIEVKLEAEIETDKSTDAWNKELVLKFVKNQSNNDNEINNKQNNIITNNSKNDKSQTFKRKDYKHQRINRYQKFNKNKYDRNKPNFIRNIPIQRKSLPNIPLKQNPLPLPKEPLWKIQIPGFPQLPPIGTDPRLLCKCPYEDPVKPIIINNTQYYLHLDRIQPCIYTNNMAHCVRFYFSFVILTVNYKFSFRLYNNRINKINLNGRYYSICICGPGHEIVINGWPYNVTIDGKDHCIKIDGILTNLRLTLNQKIDVNVTYPIPPFICDWAVKMYFGNPKYLHLLPKNPLENSNCNDLQACQFRNELTDFYQTQLPTQHIKTQTGAITAPGMPILYPKTSNIQLNESNSNFPVNNTPLPDIKSEPKPEVNIQNLLQRLIASGLISNKKSTDLKLDLKLFHDIKSQFKEFNEKEADLISSGYQCVVCGQRFKEKSKQFDLHMDYHFFQKSVYNNDSKVKSRGYYQSCDQWMIALSNKHTVQTEEDDTELCPEEITRCPAFNDDSFNKCPVCNEIFEKEWDDEEESYMLLNATIKEDKAYHLVCVDDAENSLNMELASFSEGKEDSFEKPDPLETLQSMLNKNPLPSHSEDF